MTQEERDSVRMIRDVTYRLQHIHHHVSDNNGPTIKHLDDLKDQIDNLKTAQFHMENEIAERKDPVEAREMLIRANDEFIKTPSATNYATLERAQLAYQNAYMDMLEKAY